MNVAVTSKCSLSLEMAENWRNRPEKKNRHSESLGSGCTVDWETRRSSVNICVKRTILHLAYIEKKGVGDEQAWTDTLYDCMDPHLPWECRHQEGNRG